MTRIALIATFVLFNLAAHVARAQAPAQPASSQRVVYLVPGTAPGTWVEMTPLQASPAPRPPTSRPAPGLPRHWFSFELESGAMMLTGSAGTGNMILDSVINIALGVLINV